MRNKICSYLDKVFKIIWVEKQSIKSWENLCLCPEDLVLF